MAKSRMTKQTWGELSPARRAGVIAVGAAQLVLLAMAAVTACASATWSGLPGADCKFNG